MNGHTLRGCSGKRNRNVVLNGPSGLCADFRRGVRTCRSPERSDGQESTPYRRSASGLGFDAQTHKNAITVQKPNRSVRHNIPKEIEIALEIAQGTGRIRRRQIAAAVPFGLSPCRSAPDCSPLSSRSRLPRRRWFPSPASAGGLRQKKPFPAAPNPAPKWTMEDEWISEHHVVSLFGRADAILARATGHSRARADCG